MTPDPYLTPAHAAALRQSSGDGSAATGANAAVSVTTSATVLRAANENRVVVTAEPTNGDIYVGYSSGVTTSTGTKVTSGSLFEERDFTGALYGICASGTVDTRVSEVG